jgi:NADH-quinone oxidoreductase subunit G
MSNLAGSNLVSITIDGKQLQVEKGLNLIEAAKLAGVDIPFYCYHQNLSIAGNCRMCQVEVEGQPKLTIGCNTGATEGMVVKTQFTSEKVADAQRATLEFLLINHPLDCTVCDQAGHCKLQDYYYEYNAKPSRFIEDKVNKVKAEPLGPEVIYDGERCILCTRCVRFCEEITHTNELGLYNRGDKAVIGIDPKHELSNPLSGTVVDLCPVGALTHRQWRFNTRIWYTKEVDTLCQGCSTGCNVKVALRDEQIVHVKARNNQEVNKEWLCDEGRYGFDRFRSAESLDTAYLRNELELTPVKIEEALEFTAKNFSTSEKTAVLLSPFLTLEELWLAKSFIEKTLSKSFSSDDIAMQVETRSLSDVEKVLISPDYAPNARAAVYLGLVSDSPDWRESLERKYENLINRISEYSQVLIFGDFSILDSKLNADLINALANVKFSLAVTSFPLINDESQSSPAAAQFCKVILPGSNIYQKSGLLINKDNRVQKLNKFFEPVGKYDAVLIERISAKLGKPIIGKSDFNERELFFEMVKNQSSFSELTLQKVGVNGLQLGA